MALLLCARLLLAAVFAVAGLTKLVDLPGSRKAVRDFGLPRALVGPLGTLLPLAELAVAVLLLPRATAWWGALGALALLVAFVVGIAVSMARGRAPDCHCFGQLHSEPVGWPTLARNGLLAAVAGFVIGMGHDDAGTSAIGWFATMTTVARTGFGVALILTFAVVVEGWVIFQLLQQQGRALVRLDALEARLAEGAALVPALAAIPGTPDVGLPLGTPAPDFSLTGLYGETLTLNALRAGGKPTLLVFTDPHCGPCTALLPAIGRWQREHAGMLTIALLSRGTAEENRAKSAEHGLDRVLRQQEREVAEAYSVHATPGAVLVDTDGMIGSPAALGADAIERLVGEATGGAIPLPAPLLLDSLVVPRMPIVPGIGASAPALTLPDRNGQLVGLKRYRGRPTLVLFWNPDCGFCARMQDDLKAWEASAATDAGSPQLLVVSTGTVAANAAMGLRATVVQDERNEALHAWGASGTPSAVLVDSRGQIASELAAGAEAVLALARSTPVQAA